MYTMKEYYFPASLGEAYEILQDHPGNTVIGSGTYLRLGKKAIEKGLDLSRLGLDFIRDEGSHIEIGAMATLRQLETNPLLNNLFCGILPRSVRHIVGIQLRNLATVGGNVAGRFGFSDLNTALLALDVEVELFGAGVMDFAQFLEQGAKRDIIVKLIVKKNDRQASFQMMRNSLEDYAILNAAVSRLADDWRIVVGTRPARCIEAKRAAAFLKGSAPGEDDMGQAAQMAAEEVTFGSNIRGSAAYREKICPVLVERAIREVGSWK